MLWLLLKYIFDFVMNKGFATKTTIPQKSKKVTFSKESKGRLISWSPWPSSDFKTRYPAFPLVLTLIILIVAKWYISFLR